ncbi:hypothetical protein [Paenibacillus polymyxa]|uniref:hypothetical protein n=1 Tax=Paenibacillus polymyxa TaxID=1406 RepID=UPI00234B67E5|nr:hypothetical protein [Paenibacillus polymyxa]WCM63785.1 hypothetical protein OYT09_13030 [Paenibacillus polymyxa]
MHLGMLISQKSIPEIRLTHIPSKPDQPVLWAFHCFEITGKYRNYWAAIPTNPFTLQTGESMIIELAGVNVSSDKEQAYVSFDYYNIEGLHNGVYQEIVRIKNPN